jgi:glycosyltransferase involved in cell wall biosynthesis
VRLLLVSDCYSPRVGGIERHVEDVATALHARGHAVDVLTATPEPGGAVRPGGRAEGGETASADPGPRIVRLVARNGRGLPGGIPVLPGGGAAIDRVLAAGRWDAAQVHAGPVSPFAAQVAARLVASGLPTLVTWHSRLGGPLALLRAPGLRALAEVDALPLGWPRALTAAAADPAAPVRLSGVSAPVVGDVSALAPGADVALLPGGVDTAFWSAARRGRSSRPGPATPLRLVTAGRLAPRKETGALLRAVARARRRARTPIRLTVFGDGPLRRALATEAAVLGLGDAVALPGTVRPPALRAAYAAADAFVAPARREAFGLAALEARTAGLPVVAPRGSGVETFATHGRDALLAGPGRLAEVLVALAEDTDLRERLRAGAADPPPGAGVDEAAGRTEALLRELVSGPPPRLEA